MAHFDVQRKNGTYRAVVVFFDGTHGFFAADITRGPGALPSLVLAIGGFKLSGVSAEKCTMSLDMPGALSRGTIAVVTVVLG